MLLDLHSTGNLVCIPYVNLTYRGVRLASILSLSLCFLCSQFAVAELLAVAVFGARFWTTRELDGTIGG